MKLKLRDFHAQFIDPLWNQQDLPLIDTYVLPTAEIHTTLLSGSGPSILKEKVRKTFETFSHFSLTVIEFNYTDNEIIYKWRGEGRHTGADWPSQPSGARLHFSGISAAQLEEGMISRFMSFSDFPKVLGQATPTHQASNSPLSLGFDWKPIMLAIRALTHQKLTRREIECLRLWLNGFSIKETARTLDGISIRTVQTFRENIKKKLGVKTYQQLFQAIHAWDLMPFFLQS